MQELLALLFCAASFLCACVALGRRPGRRGSSLPPPPPAEKPVEVDSNIREEVTYGFDETEWVIDEDYILESDS